MTKSGVWSEYKSLTEQLSEEMIDVVSDEFGGGLRGRVAEKGAKVSFKKVEKEMMTQGEIVVEYADAIARGGANTGQLEQEFLETNPVYKRYSGNEREKLRKHLLHDFREAGEDLAPLIASDTHDFWKAMHEEYEKQEAKAVIERNFSQSEFFKEYRGHVFPSVKIADKVIPIVEKGETQLKKQLHEKIERMYAHA